MKRMFRLLRADEIEVRVGQMYGESATLLLYQDARCGMNILDETVGAMNWKKSYSRENANCTVSIWDKESQQWVSKEDTGTESNTEAVKGLASDSFKRACVCWGIGRELYTTPDIWIHKDSTWRENGKDKYGNVKYKINARFKVTSIEYDDSGNIIGLDIINCKTNQVAFSISPPPPICPKCGNPVTAVILPDNSVVSPSEVLKKKGMCYSCSKAQKGV